MSRYLLSKTVVLVGMMGAGKTAVGTSLARSIGVDFIDSDREIEKASNLSVAEIFEQFGEDFFREKEALVLRRLLEEKPSILSTGGGAFLRKANRENIAQRGLSLWLKVDPELLWSRVKNKDTRPLLQVKDPYKTLMSIYKDRLPSYELAGAVVASDQNYSVQNMANKVVDALLEHPDNILRKVA